MTWVRSQRITAELLSLSLSLSLSPSPSLSLSITLSLSLSLSLMPSAFSSPRPSIIQWKTTMLEKKNTHTRVRVLHANQYISLSLSLSLSLLLPLYQPVHLVLSLSPSQSPCRNQKEVCLCTSTCRWVFTFNWLLDIII